MIVAITFHKANSKDKTPEWVETVYTVKVNGKVVLATWSLEEAKYAAKDAVDNWQKP